MSGIRGIFSSLASVFQSRAETGQPSLRQLPTTVPLNLTGADAAIRSMLERMSPVNAVAPSLVQNVQADQQQGAFREVNTDQMRTILGESRWKATRPRITKKMTPGQRERAMKLRTERQAKLDTKLSDYTRRMNETMQQFSIDTPLKQAMFTATVSEETIGLSTLTELSSGYASSKSTYKGRGIIQLTNEDNYLAASQYLKLGDPNTKPPYNLLVEKPELAAHPDHAFAAGGWFWSARKGGQYHETPNSRIGNEPRADLMDFREAAGLVNGGQRDRLINHWGQRLERYKTALEALQIPISNEMRKNLDEQIKQYQGKNHVRAPEQSWWDSPAGRKDIKLRKRYGIK